MSSCSSPPSPASPRRLSGCGDDDDEPTGTCSPAEPTGPEGDPTGELAELWSGEQQPGEAAPSAFFLRKPRLLRVRARVRAGARVRARARVRAGARVRIGARLRVRVRVGVGVGVRVRVRPRLGTSDLRGSGQRSICRDW